MTLTDNVSVRFPEAISKPEHPEHTFSPLLEHFRIPAYHTLPTGGTTRTLITRGRYERQTQPLSLTTTTTTTTTPTQQQVKFTPHHHNPLASSARNQA